MTETAQPEFDKIDPSIQGLRQPISKFITHPDNYRKGDVEAIAQSLIRFGQYVPVVAQQSTGKIVKGNHTMMAAQGLNWTHIAVNEKELSDTEATALLLADNALSDLADNDRVVQARLLQQLVDSGGQQALFGTGIGETQLADINDAAFALTNEVNPTEPFGGTYAKDDKAERAAEIAAQGSDEPQAAPTREVVLRVDAADAQLMRDRLNNLRKHWAEESQGVTATILRAIAYAHEAVYGTADPATGAHTQAEVHPGGIVDEEGPGSEVGETVVEMPNTVPETFEAAGAAPTTEPFDLPGEE